MIEMVLDYATVKGWREGDNPARWKGNLEHVLARKRPPTKHNAAIAIADAYKALMAESHPGASHAAFLMV